MGSLDLLICEGCLAKNTIDGAFCRTCGKALPEDVREEMKAEAEKLLIDGRQLLNDGRTDEARLVVNTVLDIDPKCANALALKGDIFEKEGLFGEALEAYQMVSEIRPDNAMDRIRVAHLEKLAVAEELAVEPETNNRKGILLVAAAGILLASVGAALTMAGNSQTDPTDGWVVSNEKSSGFAQIDAPLVPNTQGTVQQVPTVPVDQASPVSPPLTGTPSPQQPRDGFTRSNSGSGFVQANPSGDIGNSPLTPRVNLQPWQNPTPSGETPATTARPADEVPQPNNQTPTEEPEPDPGVIEIRTKPAPANSGGSAASSGAQTAEELIQQARNYSIQENYGAAAAAYEKAISMGATSGATYQRLAQCYEKLGRRSNALKAYRQAVQAFDRQISRGGDSSSVRAAKESCERAISALGG